MKKIRYLFLFLFLISCAAAEDAKKVFKNEKVKTTDEFLVKKKNPLQMPPDINKLPMPGDDLEVSNKSNNGEVKDLLKIKDDNNSEDSSSGSDLLNNMKKKIQ